MARSPIRCRRSLALAALALAAWPAGRARADAFDLTLQRLIKVPATTAEAADPGADPAALAGYRQLVSELSVALAPRLLAPADTVGYNGFQFDVDYSFTTINNRRCADASVAGKPVNQDQCPWQYGVEGTRDGQGVPTVPGNLLHTLSVTARKGIWLPLPSFELGAGATKLFESSIYTVNVYAKFALHEGFHDWPIPSLAIRGSGARVMGATGLDLTIAQVDGSISKSFGVAGSVTLVPYLGAAWLYIIPRGQVLDVTPSCDAFSGRGCPAGVAGGPSSIDLNNNALFPASANADITRWRFFGGFRLNYSVLVITTEFVATACGDINGGCPGEGQHNVPVPDNAGWQYTFSAGVGLLF